MKYTFPFTILVAAVAVDAAAVDSVNEKHWCEMAGQACDTVKRAAEAFANALSETSHLAARDDSMSETAFIARRQLDELALAIAASHHNPVVYYNALRFGYHPYEEEDAGEDISSSNDDDKKTEKRGLRGSWCTRFPGQPCWKREWNPEKREAVGVWCSQLTGQACWAHERDLEAAGVEKRGLRGSWCTRFPGQPCWKRSDGTETLDPREAADPSALLLPTAQPEKRGLRGSWCTRFPGQPCWKRSDGTETLDPREAADPFSVLLPLGQPEKRGLKGSWCTRFPGQPCWKRSDGSETLDPREAADPTDILLPVEKREASTQSRCTGQSCWKRSEVSASKGSASPQSCTRFVGESCWKRDSSPDALCQHKRCISEGGACWRAKRAAEAVISAIDAGNAANAHHTKREVEKQSWCKLFPGQPCWKRAAEVERSCYGPAGACTKATRDLHAMYNAARSILEANN